MAYVDRERCVPLRTEFYESDDKLRKVMDADPGSIERVGSHWVTRALVLQDLKNEVETRLRIASIEVDVELPDEMFLANRLQRIDCAPD